MLSKRVAPIVTAIAFILGSAFFGSSVALAEQPLVHEMTLGAEDAPITVVEYASFTCPHCKRFHEDVFSELKVKYIDTGKIKFIIRDVYFDRPGLWGSMLARCGGPEKYFGISDLLYRNQQDWTQGSDASVVFENLRQLGKAAGLKEEEITACFQDQAKAEALVATYRENAARDNISRTPSFVIDGETFLYMDVDEFSTILDDMLGE